MPISTTPSGGPQGEFSTYTPIASQTLSANVSTVTFTNIPQGYTDLVLAMTFAGSIAAEIPALQVNGDVTSTYSTTNMSGNGSTRRSARTTNATSFYIFYGAAFPQTITANATVTFPNYSNNTTFKPFIAKGQAVNGTYNGPELNAGLWRNTNPITSITLIGTNGAGYYSGSTFTLYGVKAAAAQFIPTKAAGGNLVVSDGTYAYHVFRSTGLFSPAQSLSCDYLVVAGGGGGGGLYHGGGGGAGGLRAITAQTVSSATTVTVGAGGAGGPGTPASVGVAGSNTSFGSYAVTGGGGGGSTRGDTVPFAATNGGSGGGATGYSTTLYGSGNSGGYTPVEGYRGGAGINSGLFGAGGGGGAGGIGVAATTSTGGAGGPGVNTYNTINFSSWLTATGTGSGGYLAGGGGGSCYSSGAYGVGGVGGGGNGSNQVSGTFDPNTGASNTGGGGGGSERSGSAAGAAGGSGIVIVRYAL